MNTNATPRTASRKSATNYRHKKAPTEARINNIVTEERNLRAIAERKAKEAREALVEANEEIASLRRQRDSLSKKLEIAEEKLAALVAK